MINKHQYKIRNTKKLLHKVGKQWVTVSVALLGLIGAGATASTVHADANTSLNTAPKSAVVNSVASDSNSSASKSTTSSSVSKSVSSVASSSASKVPSQASQSTNSASKASISTSSTASSSVSGSNASSISDNKNSINSTSSSSARMFGLSAPNPVENKPHTLGTTDDNQDLISTLLNPTTLLSVANANKGNSAYSNLMNTLGSMASLNFNSGNTTNFGTIYGYLTNIDTDIQSLSGNNLSKEKQSLHSVMSLANLAGGLLSPYPISYGSNASTHKTIAHYLYMASNIAKNPTLQHYLLHGVTISPTESSTIISFVDDIAQIQKNTNAANNYSHAFSTLRLLPNENIQSQETSLSQVGDDISNVLNEAKLSSTDTFTAPFKSFISEAPNEREVQINYYYNNHPVANAYIYGSNGSNYSSKLSNPTEWNLSSNSNISGTFGYGKNIYSASVNPSNVTYDLKYKSGDNNISNASYSFVAPDYVSASNNKGYAPNSFKLNTLKLSSTIPTGYYLSNSNSVITYNSANNYSIDVKPKPETANITYTNQAHNTFSSNISGVYNESVNIIPNGYKASNVNTNSYTFNNKSNQSESINIIGNSETESVNIIMKHDNNTISTKSSQLSGLVGDTVNVTPPSASSYFAISPSTTDSFLINSLTSSTITFNYESYADNQITINYENQNNSIVSSSNIQGLPNSKVTISSAPTGYSLSSNSNPTYTFSKDTQSYDVNVVGNNVSDSFTVNINKDVRGKNTLSQQKISIPARIGDTVTINPNSYIPNGYSQDSSNKVVKLLVTPRGLVNSQGSVETGTTFKYDSDQGKPVNITFTNQVGDIVQTDNISGDIDETNPMPIPDGYTENSNQPTNYTIKNTPQSININVTGKSSTCTINYMLNGTQIGKSYVATGNMGTKNIDPSKELPHGYNLTNDNTNTTYEIDGKSHNVNVTPIPMTDTIIYKYDGNQDTQGINITTHQQGSFNTPININLDNYTNNGLDNYTIAGNDNGNKQLIFDGHTHIIYVTPKAETFKINYINNGVIEGSYTINNQPYNSIYTITNTNSNMPKYWKLANGSSQKVTLNSKQINVNVAFTSPKLDINNEKIINTLLQLAKDSQQSSSQQQSYQDLLHTLSATNGSTLSTFVKPGLDLINSNENNQNNTVFGLISKVNQDISNVSNNDSHLSELNNLSSTLSKQLGIFTQIFNSIKGFINNNYENTSEITKLSNNELLYQLAFFGNRLSNQGTVHGIVAGTLNKHMQSGNGEKLEDEIGAATNALATILSNPQGKTDYQNIVNDLAKFPNQHDYQKSQILSDIANNVQDIATNKALDNIVNMNNQGDLPYKADVITALQNSVTTIISKAQDYTNPKYNDTDTITFEDTTGNEIPNNKVSLQGLDGTSITKDMLNSKVPAGYKLQSNQAPLMFVNDGDNNRTHNYVVKVAPNITTKAITIYYRDGNVLKGSKKFTITNNKSDNTLSTDNIKDNVPSGYHITDNIQPINYDNSIHVINITKNAPSQYTDNINFVTKNNHVVGSTTVFGSNGYHYMVTSVPFGYKLANKATSIVLTSSTAPIKVAVIPVTMSDTINFVNNGNQINRTGITISGLYNQKFSANDISHINSNVPTHYHLDSNNNINQLVFDNQSHDINVIPNEETDTVKFMNGTHQINSTQTIQGQYGTTKTMTLPDYYSLAKNSSNVITFNGGNHTISIQPNNVTDNVYFNTKDGKSISFTDISGLYSTKKDITSLIPNNYVLANGQSNDVTLDDKSDNVSVVPKSQAKPNNKPSNNKGNNSGSKVNPNKPNNNSNKQNGKGNTPAKPNNNGSAVKPNNTGNNNSNNTKPANNPQPWPFNIFPMPNPAQNTNSSAQPTSNSSSAQSGNVVQSSNSSYAPSNTSHVPNRAPKQPTKHSHNIRPNVLNIPSINHHPYVRHGKHMVRVNPKDIKHTRILGIVVNGKHATYYIKVGKVTGYVYGLVKPISKYELINKHAKTYIHFGKKTYRLTYKLLKHAKLVKATLTGKKLVCYVRVGHRIGHVYGRGYVAHYRFREHNHKAKVNTRYYTRVPKKVHYIKTLVPTNMYKSFHLTKHARSKHIRIGRKLRIRKLVRNHGVNRFKLTNGYYISANKKFVKFI